MDRRVVVGALLMLVLAASYGAAQPKTIAGGQQARLSGAVTLSKGEPRQFEAITGVRQLDDRYEMLPGMVLLRPTGVAAEAKGLDPGVVPKEIVVSLDRVARMGFRSVTWKVDTGSYDGTEIELTYRSGKKEVLSSYPFLVGFVRPGGGTTELYNSRDLVEVVFAGALPHLTPR
jgi:hypothetical protein